MKVVQKPTMDLQSKLEEMHRLVLFYYRSIYRNFRDSVVNYEQQLSKYELRSIC